jgi:hypothetical protein
MNIRERIERFIVWESRRTGMCVLGSSRRGGGLSWTYLWNCKRQISWVLPNWGFPNRHFSFDEHGADLQ